MSFYTALTGLNGAQADISATSNNIANVGTTGFKRSRAEFGDIFATSPLQNASSSIGSGTILKGVKQQFTQGNIASSLNALDLAVSGQGFFALKPSLTSTQTVYTRNGSFNVDNDRYVVDSAGQYLMTYPVNQDGSVTAKDLDSAVPLQLPVTSGEPKATGKIDLGVNVPADAPVVTDLEQFSDGYQFDPNDPNSYTNSTSITIFDDLGNPTIATIYFIKTQNASAEDPTNKYDTRLVINDTIIDPDLVNAVDDAGNQIFIDRFGNQTTSVPDDNYFLDGKGAPLYKLDDLNQQVDSQPATMQGEQSAFDFGEEGDKLVEIVTDPLLFAATREANNPDSDLFWGKDFLTVNVDDGDAPVSIDLRPGKYNAEQLASEVERAINEAYGDDKKIQVFQNIDDRLTIDLFKLAPDGSLQGLGDNKIEIDLLQPSSVSEIMGLDVEGASPDFTREEFLAHTQTRMVDELNDYIYDSDGTLGSGAAALGVEGSLFVRSIGQPMDEPYEEPEVVTIKHTQDDGNGGLTEDERYLSYSYYGKRPELSVYDKNSALENVDADGALTASGGRSVVYDNTQNTLTVYVPSDFGSPSSSSIRLVGSSNSQSFKDHLNGRELRIFENIPVDGGNGDDYQMLRIDTSGLNLPESGFELDGSDISILYEPSQELEAFYEGASPTVTGAFENFNSTRIVVRETGDAAKRSVSDLSLQDAIRFESTLIGDVTTSFDALGLTKAGTEYTASETQSAVDAAEIHQFSTLTASSFSDTKNVITVGTNEIVANFRGETLSTLAAVATRLNGLDDTTAAGVSFSVIDDELAVTSVTPNQDLGVISTATMTFGTATAAAVTDATAATLTMGTLVAADETGNTLTMKVSIDGGVTTEDVTITGGDWQTGAGGTAAMAAATQAGFDAAFGANVVTAEITTGGTLQLSTVEKGGGYAIDLTEVSSDLQTTFGLNTATGGNSSAVDGTREFYEFATVDPSAFSQKQNVITIGDVELDIDFRDVAAISTMTEVVTAANALGLDHGIEFQSVNGKLRARSVVDGVALSSVEIQAITHPTTTASEEVVGETTTESHTFSGVSVAAMSGNINVINVGETSYVADFRDESLSSVTDLVTKLNGVAATTASGVVFSEVSGSLVLTARTTNTDLGVVSIEPDVPESKVAWVDENKPPIKVSYDETNQRLQFNVDRTVLGTGTNSNFNAFTVYGAADADSTNGLGIPSGSNAEQVLIRGGEILSTESFIADGEEIQLNDKRYGVSVSYNGDTKSFTVASGTTGENISSDGALGVDTDQKSSNIQIGRRIISAAGDGSTDQSEVINLDSRIIGGGENALFGFGASKEDFTFQEGRGLAAKPAVAVGRTAQGDLTEVFRLTSNNGENRFNVSVNGIAGIIDIPPGNYVGTTLATALEERINQISDPSTGQTVGGVTVRYSTTDNAFEFQTGTTGGGSTVKVKGAARLGLDDVPLGVGSVPKIFNLVQATNADGIALYVDPTGEVVTTPPEDMVEGYYPLYIDEGELTFDKTGKLVSPKNNVRYEQQAEGFSISLDIDYSASSQFAQPFSVLSVEQDGFTSGRLDGLEIDSSGTIRANYTNGQNNPLGKIVVANFNNQNGLKQIGNATYVETAVSGTPQVGEAGAEGFGNILSGSLERSNVDITEELVNLITAQRNYQASAKAIETTTSLTQTIINIRM